MMVSLLSFIVVFTTFEGSDTWNDDHNTSPQSDSLTDIDGNVYHTVTIGITNKAQVWMAENLKVTRYQNGDSIPKVTNSKVWNNLTTAAYCDYDNKPINSKTYGRLYNWYAVADSNNICPPGWHIPTDDEWFNLTYFLGENVAGSKLKEAGTVHWRSPNINASNETGFTALPGGYRGDNGLFYEIGFTCYLWSSSEFNLLNAWTRKMLNSDGTVKTSYEEKRWGFSVRCIKD